MPLRTWIRRQVSSRRLSTLWAPLTSGRVCIFTLHRFGAEHDTGMHGVDLDALDAILARLRADGFRLLSLQEAVHALEHPASLATRSVVFTVDDGYADFALGAEVFLDHACPVTVFLTTGFIDGANWMWWDEVEFLCTRGAAGEYTLLPGGARIRLAEDDFGSRIAVAQDLWSACKRLSEPDKQQLIRELQRNLGVTVPQRPTPAYAPLTWDQIRRLERRGVGFAPHTVSHPLLSRLSGSRAAWEINESWRRVRAELAQPIPILAYPNGQAGDFGEREFDLARAAGLEAAVTMTLDYASAHHFRSSPAGRFTVPRFAEPSDPDDACRAGSGFYRLSRLLRGRRGQ